MSTTHDAAKRLRRLKAGDWPSDYLDWDRAEDRQLLVDAYLAEHPADDSELITEEWLRSVGARPKEVSRTVGKGKHAIEQRYNRFVLGELGGEFDELSLVKHDSDGWWAMLGSFEFPDTPAALPRQRTRGDLRRLAQALGIELKAGGSE